MGFTLDDNGVNLSNLIANLSGSLASFAEIERGCGTLRTRPLPTYPRLLLLTYLYVPSAKSAAVWNDSSAANLEGVFTLAGVAVILDR
jgi:hypothetical protein